jgi:hypothetical protein
MAGVRQVRIDMGDYYKLPHPQLKLYLQRQVRGNDQVYTTPFGGEESEFWSSFEEWLAYLNANLTDLPTLLDYENDLAKKVGPMSVEKPLVERMQSLKSYYSDIETPQSEIDPVFVTRTFERWGRPRQLTMFSKDQSVQELKKSTNSGSPYFTKRKLVLEKGLIGAVNTNDNVWYITNSDGTFRATATLGWRGQEGGPDVDLTKQRDLWMFPMDLNIDEARLYKPLVEWGQRSGNIASWLGNDAVDKRITKLFDTKGDSDFVLCTDFTKFDQHFGVAMRNAALAAYDKMFGGSDAYEWWKNDNYNAKYYIPIVIAWKKALMGEHGMASGSGGTNADETIGHSILQTEAALTAGAILNPNSMCLGDDGIISYNGINVDHVLDVYTSHGQEMNETKQYISREDLTYLRRWHSKHYRINGVCVGVYSTARALGKLKYLERFHKPEVWGPKAICSRSLSIIENCKYHPLREEFLDFCIKRDKFRLGIDIPGYLENFSSEIEQAVANGVLGYQYTDSFAPAPAKSWWVYKALLRRKG